MAIDLGSKQVTANVQDRSWRVEVFCEYGADPEIRFHRATIALDGELIVTQTIGAVSSRMLSTVADEVHGSATVQQVIDALFVIGDDWRQQDIEAGIETPPPGDDA